MHSFKALSGAAVQCFLFFFLFYVFHFSFLISFVWILCYLCLSRVYLWFQWVMNMVTQKEETTIHIAMIIMWSSATCWFLALFLTVLLSATCWFWCESWCRSTISGGIKRKSPHQTSSDFAALWPNFASKYLLSFGAFDYDFALFRFLRCLHYNCYSSECESLGLSDFPTAGRLQWHGYAPGMPDWSDKSRFVAFTLVSLLLH